MPRAALLAIHTLAAAVLIAGIVVASPAAAAGELTVGRALGTNYAKAAHVMNPWRR